VWSTIVVIAGIGLVWAGETWNLPWLNYADALAGLAVAAVILWVGAQLGRRTLDALLDAAPQGLPAGDCQDDSAHGRRIGCRSRARSARGQSPLCGLQL